MKNRKQYIYEKKIRKKEKIEREKRNTKVKKCKKNDRKQMLTSFTAVSSSTLCKFLFLFKMGMFVTK